MPPASTRAMDTFQPTGDALFDRLGRAVLRRYCASTNLPLLVSRELKVAGFGAAHRMFRTERTAAALDAQLEDRAHNHLPTEREIAAWEPEFGGDPRYWHLRYLARSQHRTISERRFWERERVEHYAPLLEAWRRGVADSVICDQLCHLVYYADESYATENVNWRERHRKHAAEHATGRPEMPQEAEANLAELEVVSALARGMLAGTEISREGLRRAAVEYAPGLAWPRLKLASLLIEQDRIDEALDEVGHASHGQPGWCAMFPQSALQPGLWAGKAPGCTLLAGLLHLPCGQLHTQFLYAERFRYTIQPLRKHCIERGRHDLLPILRRSLLPLAQLPFAGQADLHVACVAWLRYLERWQQLAFGEGRAGLTADLAGIYQRLREAHTAHTCLDCGLAAATYFASAYQPRPRRQAGSARHLGGLREILLNFWWEESAKWVDARLGLLPVLAATLAHPAVLECWDQPLSGTPAKAST